MSKRKPSGSIDKLLSKPSTSAYGDEIADSFAQHAREMMQDGDARLSNDVLQVFVSALAIMVAMSPGDGVEEVIVRNTRSLIKEIQAARAAIAEAA